MMNYDTLYEIFINKFKDDEQYFDEKKREYCVNDDDGQHVKFAIIVLPYIVEKLNSDDEAKLKMIFDFVEQMENDANEDVQNVANVSILEGIAGEGQELYDKARKYMKSKTLSISDEIVKYMDIK